MKIVGIFVVMVCCCYTGKYFSDNEQKKLGESDELCTFLEELSAGIRQRIKLDEIISAYCNMGQCEYIKGRNKVELCQWLDKAGYNGEDGEIRRIVRNLLSEIGKSSDLSFELEKCRTATDMAKKVRAKTSEESRKKKELYKKLGFISGLILCVLFV